MAQLALCDKYRLERWDSWETPGYAWWDEKLEEGERPGLYRQLLQFCLALLPLSLLVTA